jgi:phage gpG-like protein
MELTINIAGQEQVIRALDEHTERAADISPVFADFGERMVRRISRRISQVFEEQSGRLGASLTYQEGPDSLTISAGGSPGGGADAVRYARIQHEGGTIRPKKAKFLTIPFPGGPADQRVPLRASDFDDTFIAKGIIFRTTSRGGRSGGEQIEPLFILKRSVTLPARPYMYVEDSDVAYLKKSVADYISGKWG